VKKGFAILYILLFFMGCQQKQSVETVRHANPEPSALVIDRPAVVFFNSSKPDNPGKLLKVKGSVEKILNPFKIPVISSASGNFEFVKSNGDRVKLNIEKLPSRYDVILFNAVNDPVPCLLKDLRKAAKDCFSKKTPALPGKEASATKYDPVDYTADESVVPREHDSLFHIRSRKGKNIRIDVPDTASVPLALRNVEGVRWIENHPDKRSFLSIRFENDLITYANTDRYFTNGIAFTLQAPWLAHSRLSQLMLPYHHSSTIAYSLELVQNMYTPKDTRIAPTFSNDRPYSSYLYLGYKKIIADPFRKIRLSSEAEIGYLGPYSPGAYLQTLVHESFPTNDKPLGWETQINTDIILNYNLRFEKALISQRNLMVSVKTQVKAGTLYSQAGIGMRLQAGKQESYFSCLPGKESSSWQYFFFIDATANCIGYDATLQGGLFDRDNTFTLKSNEISRYVGTAEGGFQVRYKGTGLEVAQHYLSPEYKGGLGHKWGRISLIFKL
jgi:lipid A 3-O-deacylase